MSSEKDVAYIPPSKRTVGFTLLHINELPQYLIDNYDTKQRVIRASKHWASFLPDGKTMVEDKTMFIFGAKAIPYWSCRPCTKSEYELQNQ